jgi:hypothetical protein
MRDKIEAGLSAKLDPALVKELLDAHAEAKTQFFLGGLRLSGVEGGRFCEAAFRLLEFCVERSYTALCKPLDTDKLIEKLRSLSGATFVPSIRLHIPRALRVVYDVRNNRDLAHLADGIDPNLQDATLVIGVIDWVLAEFVRLFHSVPPNEARVLVEDIVARAAPVAQDFEGDLKILNPDLSASDHLLVLLYQRGAAGAALEQLRGWARPTMRKNILRTLSALEHDRAFIHCNGEKYRITATGQLDVEKRGLIRLDLGSE